MVGTTSLAAEHRSDACGIGDQCGCRVGIDALPGLGFHLVDERTEDLARARRIARGVGGLRGHYLVGKARASADTLHGSAWIGRMCRGSVHCDREARRRRQPEGPRCPQTARSSNCHPVPPSADRADRYSASGDRRDNTTRPRTLFRAGVQTISVSSVPRRSPAACSVRRDEGG